MVITHINDADFSFELSYASFQCFDLVFTLCDGLPPYFDVSVVNSLLGLEGRVLGRCLMKQLCPRALSS